MTREEQKELLLCISTRVCVIETGDPVLRASDLQARLEAASREDKPKWAAQMRSLSTSQMKLILLLENLSTKISKAKTED